MLVRKDSKIVMEGTYADAKKDVVSNLYNSNFEEGLKLIEESEKLLKVFLRYLTSGNSNSIDEKIKLNQACKRHGINHPDDIPNKIHSDMDRAVELLKDHGRSLFSDATALMRLYHW